MNKKVLVISIVALAVIIGLIIWYQRQSADKQAVKLGYIEYTADLPFFVALEKGFFTEEGVKVKPIKFASSSECLNAMLAGHTSGSMGNSFSALFAIEMTNPGELKIFFPMFETKENYVSHLLIPKDSKISSVLELRGKKIGTYTGATQLLFLKLFLKTYDIDPEKDVTIIQVSSALQIQALEAGQFDALFTIEPYATIALAKGIAKDLLPFSRGKILNPFPAGASSFSTSFLEENPEAARRIYQALGKAVDLIRSDPREAKLVVPKYTPLDEELALKSNVYTWWKEDEIKPEAIQKEIDLFIQHKILEGELDVEDILMEKISMELE